MSGTNIAEIPGEFPLVLGGSLPSLTIAWEEWGDPAAPPERTVFVMPALSASSHLRTSDQNPSPGWWEDMVGPGLGIDTDRFRVICGAIIGSPMGSTCPLSVDPRSGQPYGRDFPQLTPADLATAHATLLKHLGIERVHAAVGASLGGMQVLQFAARHPEMVGRIASISATGKTTPGTVALRRVGRLAIMNDPDFADGRYEPGRGPARGLAVARELATITYRSREEFDHRFDWNPQGPYTARALAYEVESYLDHQGRRFANMFDANCYLLLSRCMDLMDLGAGEPTYAEGVLRIQCPSWIVGVDHDILIPPAEQRHLAHLLESHGREVTFDVLNSIYGHDAFLKEYDWFVPRMKRFLEDD